MKNNNVMEKMILINEAELRELIGDALKNFVPMAKFKHDDEQPVSQQEICNFLNITEPTLIRWKRKGVVPFLQIGSRVLFQKSKVILALENKKGAKHGK